MGLYLFNPNTQMGWVKTYPNKMDNRRVHGYGYKLLLNVWKSI